MDGSLRSMQGHGVWVAGLAVVLLSVSGAAPPASGYPVPVDAELQPNAFIADDQFMPAVAMAPGGSFVVVWAGEGESDGAGVFARFYDGAGVAQGDEFRVNSYTTGPQSDPAVAAEGDGGFVVVWSGEGEGDLDGVFAQRYDGAGVAQGEEFRVNSYTAGAQSLPAVAAGGDGGFVVVWSGEGQGEPDGVFGRRYDSDGVAQGGDFRVNTYTSDPQSFPAVAVAPAGSFVVVWDGEGETDAAGVFARRYDSAGVALGDEFRVNADTTGPQLLPAVAAVGDGGFVVVWSGEGQGDVYGVFGRRYDGAGVAQGDEFRASTETVGSQSVPGVAAAGDGDFVVVWESPAQDGDGFGIFGQRFDATGIALGRESRVNTYTTSDQGNPAVAAASNGDFVVVWESFGQDGDSFGISGQRFEEPCGNGALDAGEDCDDGNVQGGDCCSAACSFEPLGSVCGDDGNVCTDDRCDGAGLCVAIDNAAGCDDEDPCSAVDECQAGECVGRVVTIAGLVCRLDELLAAPCQAEVLPPKLAKRLGRRVERSRRFLERAEGAAAVANRVKVEKFRKRTVKQLDAIPKHTARAAGARAPITETCKATIDALAAARRHLIDGFLF